VSRLEIVQIPRDSFVRKCGEDLSSDNEKWSEFVNIVK